MTRISIICLLMLAFAGCKKSSDAAIAAKARQEIDDKAIQDYITKNNLAAKKIMRGKEDTTGIWYVKTVTGTETALITTSSLLTVGYTAKQMGTDKVFAETGTFHPSYRLGEMIRGWQYYFLSKELMKKGDKIRLLIASRYAYGPYEQQSFGLPANAILDFDIELFNVTN